MNATFESLKPTSTANKPLWAAVGVLGVAVLAMGATLIHIQTRPADPRAAVLSAAPPAAPVATPALPLHGGQDAQQKQATALVNKSPVATKFAANSVNKPVRAPVSGNAPMTPVASPVCANCGTVESVTPIQRAVTGGVLGAVVGNQVGGGNGKTLATILGAVGGGFAGNAVEKKINKVTVYQVRVRMEDGTTRTAQQSAPAAVGSHVVFDGNTLQSASR
jgi:uncharacterized protein YcfJ